MGDLWDWIQEEIRNSVPDSSWINEVYSKLFDDISFEVKAFLGASHNTSFGDCVANMKEEELKVFKKRLLVLNKKRGDKLRYRVKMTRLEGICELCSAHIRNLFEMMEGKFHGELEEYLEKVRRLCLYGLNVEHDDEDVDYDSIIKVKWFDRTFHGRFLFLQSSLLLSFKQSLCKCLALNYGFKRIMGNVGEMINRSKNSFVRFYKTETMHFANIIIQREYKLHGVEKYIFNASPHEKGCIVCGGLDKSMFKVSDILVGANYPTMHPRCDCLTRPSLYLPNEKTFEEWEKLVFVK